MLNKLRMTFDAGTGRLCLEGKGGAVRTEVAELLDLGGLEAGVGELIATRWNAILDVKDALQDADTDED